MFWFVLLLLGLAGLLLALLQSAATRLILVRLDTQEEVMDFNVQDDGSVVLSVAGVDAKGNPAALNGSIAWASGDQTVLLLSAVASHPEQVKVAAVGKLGTTTVTATYTPSGGGTPLTQSANATVVAGPVAALQISLV